MTEMMRAMVLSECKKIEDKPLKLTNIERHTIDNPDEVLIKIEACGVCHSQLHGIEGDWQEIGIPPSFPTVPGHEVVGKIIEIGDKVTKFRIGDRVGITPLLKSCMNCRYCEKNQSMNVADYTIIAESDEYAAVPEFPLGSGALLIISVSSYVIFSRNPERITNALGRCSKILARQ